VIRASRSGATGYEDLALETLMFAWQVSREDRHIAQIVFGMVPLVADRIATVTMKQVRTIAPESSKSLTMRWGDDSQFWRELLISAKDADESALARLRHDAKLRFCGELIHVGAAR
jgi:hypothetical protein